MTGFGLLSFLGTLAVVAMTDIKATTQVECESPFTEVGGRCVHIGLSTMGSWHDMRKFCQDLGGELVNLADVQFYSDLILYIEILRLSKMHFWIGSTDEAIEDMWVWTDGSATRMGTPFWANYGKRQRPNINSVASSASQLLSPFTPPSVSLAQPFPSRVAFPSPAFRCPCCKSRSTQGRDA
ncbi:hypothetical protein O3P69_015171 [Scylla paramamosain]|uniref:C-type lectin domain-containing protein n=1 Tax=Scylla paramamosain TaxID=85552 RepID=A0AAW0T473_SCYPA